MFFSGGEKPGKPPTGIAPAFKEKPKVAQDASGKNIVIECQCSANPKPTITWYKGTSTLQASSRIVPTLIENGNEYTLKLEILVGGEIINKYAELSFEWLLANKA